VSSRSRPSGWRRIGARRWRGAARRRAWQAYFGGIVIFCYVVPSRGEAPAILEVFCNLHGSPSAAALQPGCCDQRGGGDGKAHGPALL
jgi:hypothetical protein